MFDVAKVPFSRWGSYFSVSINSWGPLGEGLYLRTHYDNSPQVFKIDVVRGDEVVGYEVEALPSILRLRAEGGGEAALVMEGQETMRVRAEGVGLRFEMVKERWTTAYEMPGGVWAVNLSRHAVQVAIEALAGELRVDTSWERGQGFCWETSRLVVALQPGEQKRCEAAIDNFVTTWIKPQRAPFDEIQKAAGAEYAKWTEGLPRVGAEHEAARDLAGYVNWSSTVAAAGYMRRPTMLMSKMSMCNVYGWDHAFNAMAHCTHRPAVAWDQLMVMSDHQDAYGKCPTSMNRNDIRYTISNAPVQGWALRRMWDENPAMLTPERMAEAYEYLSRWSDWICEHRTWPGERLAYYQHGFDSGWDNSTIFDAGVPMVSPDQPAYLILQMEVVADLAEALGREKEAETWRARAKAMLKELVEKLWRGDRFVGMLRPSGKEVDCESLITCMPMVLGRRLPAEVVKPLVSRIRDHLTPYGLATEKLDSDRYMEGGYWRGPIWAPSTMLIVTGLLEVGEQKLARTIMERFCSMCAEQGFYENFSPKTGEGHYCPAYTWTSSVFMMFAKYLCDQG